uniref:Uncharacterized protein n=1 Tax=Anguilla anguilla TaxID=7936 RepID=A0A0E9TNF8_ANGAN
MVQTCYTVVLGYIAYLLNKVSKE